MNKRKARQFVWVHPDDCIPPHGLDLQLDRHYLKVQKLREEFINNGFDLTKSALVGYPLDGKIQLLSGTHRHLAAKEAGILLPVTLWLRSDVERLWGTDQWKSLIEDVPVLELQKKIIEDGFKIPNYERINTHNLYRK